MCDFGGFGMELKELDGKLAEEDGLQISRDLGIHVYPVDRRHYELQTN